VAGVEQVPRHRAAHRAQADARDAAQLRISEKWITVTVSSSRTSRL
jgi:hypothetical protein